MREEIRTLIWLMDVKNKKRDNGSSFCMCQLDIDLLAYLCTYDVRNLPDSLSHMLVGSMTELWASQNS